MSSARKKLEIIPLGGLGEFGMNMMALRFGEEMLIIDTGMMFPDESLMGVDVVIPDLSFLAENAGQVRGMVITHAHEDHIGALPFVLKTCPAPVYGARFTLALAEHKLQEHGLLDSADLRTVAPGDRTTVGPFEIEFIRAAHSTIDCIALAVFTPVGTLIHATDFKLDESPIIGDPTDLARLKEIARGGVLALLCDSTNVERPGRTPSEQEVVPAFERIFEECPGRLIFTCFASSIHRIQIILALAEDFQCKVLLVGQTMLRMVEIAAREGYLELPDGLLITPQQVAHHPSKSVVMLATGCQGEPLSALSRMATGSFKQLRIEPGDTVILSARVIPGNERSISRLMNHLYKRGAQVIDESVERVHVSGHPYQEDLRILYQTVQPRFLIPIHGDYRRLHRHKEFAVSAGLPAERVLLAENGDIIAFDAEGAQILPKQVAVGRTFIDEAGFEEIEEFIIRDRRHLAEDGFIIPIVAINEVSGELEAEPEMVTRGFVLPEEDGDLMRRASDLIVKTIQESDHDERIDWAVMKEKIRVELKRFISKETERRPMIIPVIIEI